VVSGASGDPRAAILAAASGHVLARAIHVAAELGLADRIEEPVLAGELAPAIGADAAALYRLMHFLARHDILAEDEAGRFTLTETGAMLRADAPAQTAAVIRSLAAPGMWNAFGGLIDAVRTGVPAGHWRNGRLYEGRGTVPEEKLGAAMIGYHAGEPDAVAEAYDFGGLERIVDVGGSSGNLLSAILRRYPEAHGTVYDRPGIAEEAGRRFMAMGLAQRARFVGGNFFDSVPAGGHLYILSHILHDWSDADALRILCACRRGMGSEAKLIVLEALMVPAGTGETEIPADLLLLASTEGRFRTREEHAALLAAAGFRLMRVVACGAPVSIIEAAVAAM
jgi:hypothetical protein